MRDGGSEGFGVASRVLGRVTSVGDLPDISDVTRTALWNSSSGLEDRPRLRDLSVFFPVMPRLSRLLNFIQRSWSYFLSFPGSTNSICGPLGTDISGDERGLGWDATSASESTFSWRFSWLLTRGSTTSGMGSGGPSTLLRTRSGGTDEARVTADG